MLPEGRFWGYAQQEPHWGELMATGAAKGNGRAPLRMRLKRHMQF